MTPEQMAQVIFENYDPTLRTWAKPGDVIVGGLNFGTGSSREQAATALKHFGIPCVIAASFSETYKRNAFNNGFVCFECPPLVEWLRGAGVPSSDGSDKTRVIGQVDIDYRAGTLRVSPVSGEAASFSFTPLSPVAQELVVSGGAEEVVKRRLAGMA